MALFLVVALALVGLYIMVQISTRKRLQRFANTDLLDSVSVRRLGRRRHVAPALMAVALLVFAIALAGPTQDERIPRNRAVVMLVIDVSQSMMAKDVEPSRLAAAQAASKKFVDELTPASTSA